MCVCVCVRVCVHVRVCVTGSKTFLNDIKTQISSVTDEIPLAALSNVSERIEQMQSEINRLTPRILHLDSIR